jgi:hypothetical protein
MAERKRTGAYARGYEDAVLGAAPDYGQGTREGFADYCAGYERGLQERREPQEEMDE